MNLPCAIEIQKRLQWTSICIELTIVVPGAMQTEKNFRAAVQVTP